MIAIYNKKFLKTQNHNTLRKIVLFNITVNTFMLKFVLSNLPSDFAEMEATVINMWSKNHLFKKIGSSFYQFILPINIVPINTQYVQSMQANSLQSCPTLCDPVDVAHQAPLSMGILQTRILEWVAISSSKGSSQHMAQTHIYSIKFNCLGHFASFHLWKILVSCTYSKKFICCMQRHSHFTAADGDYSHEIKRYLLLGRKIMTNLDSIFKSRVMTLPTKVCLVKAMIFPVVTYGCES